MDDTARSGLGPPAVIHNQDDVPQTSLIQANPQLRLSDDPRLG